MSELLQSLASYVPPAVLRAVLTNPIALDGVREEYIPAAVLFADVSGFTPLTEALAQQNEYSVKQKIIQKLQTKK